MSSIFTLHISNWMSSVGYIFDFIGLKKSPISFTFGGD